MHATIISLKPIVRRAKSAQSTHFGALCAMSHCVNRFSFAWLKKAVDDRLSVDAAFVVFGSTLGSSLSPRSGLYINPFRTAVSFWGQLGTNYLEFGCLVPETGLEF